jgi:hypothetical protein
VRLNLFFRLRGYRRRGVLGGDRLRMIHYHPL